MMFNALTFRFDYSSVHSNIKSNSIKLVLLNVNFLRCTFVKRRQQISIKYPKEFFNTINNNIGFDVQKCVRCETVYYTTYYTYFFIR